MKVITTGDILENYPYDSISTDYNYDTIVTLNIDINIVSKIKNYNKLISLFVNNKGGCIFVDYKNYKNIKDKQYFVIEGIVDNTIIFTEEHSIKDGDVISFVDMKGENVDFKDMEVKVVSSKSIYCNLPKKFKFINGRVIIKNNYTEYKHKSIIHNKIKFNENMTKETPLYNHMKNIISYELLQLFKNKSNMEKQVYTCDFKYKQLDKKYNLQLIDFNYDISDSMNDFDYITFTNKIKNNNSNTIVISGNTDYTTNNNYSCLAENNNSIFISSSINNNTISNNTIVPFFTNKYSDIIEPVNKKSYMECKVQHFTNCIGHTIQWTQNIINNMIEYNKELKLQDYNSLYDVVKKCKNKWKELFIDNINKLSKDLPHDNMNKDGSLYWSNGKVFPRILEYSDKYSDCIYELVKIYCMMLNQKYNKNDIMSIINDVKTTDNYIFTNKKKVILDKNMYIDVAYQLCNCRNMNYYLENVSKDIIAKNIFNIMDKHIYSIMNSLSILQAYNCVYNSYSNVILDLNNMNTLTKSYDKPKTIKIGTNNISIWEKFEEKNNITLQEFIDKWSKFFNTEINFVGYGSGVLYMGFMENTKLNLVKKLNELVNSDNKSIAISSDEIEDLPDISINF